MELLGFFIFSFIEFCSGLILILAMFRFKIRDYIPHIAFASFMLTQVSYLMFEVLDAKQIAPFVQLIIMFLFIWLLFRVQVFYAAIMASLGYIAFALFQMIVFVVFTLFRIMPIDNLLEDRFWGSIIQLSTSILATILAWFLNRSRIGFSFVPDNDRESIDLKYENVRFLIAVSIAILTVAVCFLYLSKGIYLLVNFILLLLILAILFYLSLKRESNE